MIVLRIFIGVNIKMVQDEIEDFIKFSLTGFLKVSYGYDLEEDSDISDKISVLSRDIAQDIKYGDINEE